MFQGLFLHVSLVFEYFAPILVPGEIYDVMQGEMNFHIFTIWVQNWVLSPKT